MVTLQSVSEQLQSTAQFVALFEIAFGVMPVGAQPAHLPGNVAQPL